MKIHTSTYRGKRVLCILRDGRRVVGKFLDKKRAAVVLDSAEIPVALLRCMTILRGPEQAEEGR